MSTLAEIEEAIATLPASDVERLAVFLEKRRVQQPAWAESPPKVGRAELERIEAGIEREFPRATVRNFIGVFSSGDANGADNGRVDADMARELSKEI